MMHEIDVNLRKHNVKINCRQIDFIQYLLIALCLILIPRHDSEDKNYSVVKQ
jgi:hypothetical protein